MVGVGSGGAIRPPWPGGRRSETVAILAARARAQSGVRWSVVRAALPALLLAVVFFAARRVTLTSPSLSLSEAPNHAALSHHPAPHRLRRAVPGGVSRRPG